MEETNPLNPKQRRKRALSEGRAVTAPRLQNSAPGGAGGDAAAAAAGAEEDAGAGTTTLGDNRPREGSGREKRGSGYTWPLSLVGAPKSLGKGSGWQVGPAAAPRRATSPAPAAAAGPLA
ncbi:unnamed protein product [Rangifer tarandus platyrhynchus]|uniref:Uncharacterized protein n=2 Tax=Rangifer tarandus platyrhynchus TaxID=3082113 RepID=A0ABN8XYV1_RANTA|nr:unnamed protein product [Rangifer tarandus platyrhynchus]CAI9712918.1 unnamed protein product [Rangifer tarandus platyrhynchus]